MQFAINASTLQDGREEDGGTIETSSFDGSLSFQPVEAADIQLFARRNDRESTGFPDSSGGIRYAVIRALEHREADETSYGANLSIQALEQLGFKLQLSQYERNEDINTPGVAPGVGSAFELPVTVSNTDFTRDSALISASVKLPLSSDLTIGYERLEEKGETLSAFNFFGPIRGDFRLTRDTDSTFAELKSKSIGDLVVMLDLRHDRVSNLESETSAGAGIRYDLTSTGTSLNARYAEGFRPPSFYSLADPNVGDPNLVSETSRAVEIGAEQLPLNDKLQIGVTAFRTKTKNLIDFDATAFSIVNRDSAEAEGIEAQVTVRPFDSLGITGSYTHVETDILNSSDNLGNRPRDRASITVSYAISQPWQLTWNTIYVGEFYDFSVPTGDVKADSYTRSDVAVSYKWQRYTASVAVDNVFDENYESFVGFENPSVRLRGAISTRF